MSAPFFSTAEEAAEKLGIPLLGTASAATAVPRVVRRLSALAPQAVLGARLYNRLAAPAEAPAEKIWITSPEETQERLAWAVALAEQAARSGRTAFLLDLDRPSALSGVVGGGGRALPEAVQEAVTPLAGGPAALWSSDLQGVRVLLPVEHAPTEEAIDPPNRWSLIVVRALPAGAEGAERIAAQVGTVVLAVSIRDHERTVLEETVDALRRAESASIGLIGLGPAAEPDAESPLDRWRAQSEPERTDGEETPGPSPTPLPREPSEKPDEKPEPREDPPADRAETGPGPSPSPAARRGRRRALRNTLWIFLLLATVALGVYIYSETTLLSVLERGERERAEETTAAPHPPPVERSAPTVEPVRPPERQTDPFVGPPRAPEESFVGPPDARESEVGTAAGDTLLAGPPAPPVWSDTFVVHVSSFRRHEDALREVTGLRNLGLTARVVPVILADRGRWERVVVGAFPDSLSAVAEANRMRDVGLVPFAQILGGAGAGDALRIAER
ncbi:MAG: hypothetical protein GF346_11495 [Candidatus Eisenbacteria bacterium]|nr:hypothetical protein [Candidatus Latescibacterota bacterium]MBD3303060.1 hypothetical protein [Candidatus Eisenbacteria bacterium]